MSRHLSSVASASEPHGDNSDAGGGCPPPVEPGQEGALALLQAENAELERELRGQRRRIAQLLRLVQGQDDRKRATYLAAAQDIDAYWRESCHPSARPMKPNGPREKAVIGRLADGYSIGYIKRAVDGAKRAPNRSDSGEAFDDLELICRNEVKLDSFHRRAPRSQGGNERWLGPRFDPTQ